MASVAATDDDVDDDDGKSTSLPRRREFIQPQSFITVRWHLPLLSVLIMGLMRITKSSAMAEGLRDALVSIEKSL